MHEYFGYHHCMNGVANPVLRSRLIKSSKARRYCPLTGSERPTPSSLSVGDVEIDEDNGVKLYDENEDMAAADAGRLANRRLIMVWGIHKMKLDWRPTPQRSGDRCLKRMDEDQSLRKQGFQNEATSCHTFCNGMPPTLQTFLQPCSSEMKWNACPMSSQCEGV